MDEASKTNKPDSDILKRLEAVSGKLGLTTDELISKLEEYGKTTEEDKEKAKRSTGSQRGADDSNFDPTATEFLKGIWGK